MLQYNSPRWVYVGKCVECNASIYYNTQEEKYRSNSNLPDHQCRLEDDQIMEGGETR